MDKGVGDSEHAIWTSTHAASDQAHGRNQGGWEGSRVARRSTA